MTNVRQPNVAGTFYPAEREVLKATIKDLLAKASISNLPAPKAIIAPHAGYIYSGPIAATIYKTLLPQRDVIKRVVLLGPAHRVAFEGIAITNMDSFRTPLGNVAVDKESNAIISKLLQVNFFESAYDMEHCLEVQLPFLQSILSRFTIVPCIVGNSSPTAVAEVIKALWGDPTTLIVISSDLSHYLDYSTAQRLDSKTNEAIKKLLPDDIHHNQACGSLPIRGLLLAAQQLQLKATTLDLRNSGDTAGDHNRVVGYGAYHFV